MSCASRPSAWSIAAALAAAPLLPGAGGTALAQAGGWRETQLLAAGVASRPAFGGAGLGLARRDAGRTRLGAAALVGALEGGEVAGRVELAWHFLLDPARRRGLGVYGGGGLAVATQPGGRLVARLQLALGAESSPALRRGWFVEAGVGGGARLAAGLRWRSRRGP